ncbi:hypothetical protein Agub_g8889 [Astrephomene gubernaculifera]|uniref:Glutaredoxin domain-containing protein n=1 Tax=Astrephomene gubernaculifera TaxID=47775 RepID=A0AAD3HMU7_9CHLO|nr:hypothetical protein Agub_g8889 [Astrephomene gubernaculifera]
MSSISLRQPSCVARQATGAALPLPRIRTCSTSYSPRFNGVIAAPNRSGAPISRRAIRVSAASGMSPELKRSIDEFISANKIVVFMKGTRQFPQCGFSNTVVQILNTLGVPYETVNILEDERLRSGMKEYSQWPTFPQRCVSHPTLSYGTPPGVHQRGVLRRLRHHDRGLPVGPAEGAAGGGPQLVMKHGRTGNWGWRRKDEEQERRSASRA